MKFTDDPLRVYRESEDTVRRIYNCDVKEGRYLHVSVAIAKHALESIKGSGYEQWLKERRLDEMGMALIRELYKHEGKDVRVVVTQTAHYPRVHVPEFRHSFDARLYPLTRIS